MKILLLTIISLILFSMAVAGCGNRDVDGRLDHADSIMESAPDSARKALEAIDRSKLDESQRARHALLLSQAYDKTYYDVADDSLIGVALDYYMVHPQRRDLLARSCYYQGVVAFNAADYQRSIHYLLLADTLAAGLSDFHLRGMANAKLAWCNTEIHDFETEYQCTERAVHFFTLDADTARASRQIRNLAICHLQLNRPSEALATLDMPACAPSAVTRASCLARLGRINEFHAMLDEHPELRNNSRVMADYAWHLIESGDIDEAERAVERASKNAKNEYDSAFCMIFKAEVLRKRGDVKGYADITLSRLKSLINSNNKYKKSAKNKGYTEAIQAISAMEKAESDRLYRNIISILAAVVIILMAFIMILRLKRQRDRMQYSLSLSNIRYEYNQIQLAETTGGTSVKTEVAPPDDSKETEASQETVNRIAEHIIEVANEYFVESSAKRKRQSELKQEISAIMTEDIKRELEHYVDLNTHGVVAQMRCEEKIKEIDIEVFVLDYLGMSNNMIMVLTDSVSVASVASRKTRLRKLANRIIHGE